MKEIKKKFARYLRKNQTSSEEKVWKLLRNRKSLGLKFRRQHVFEGFVVDFYCKEYRLALEIDGGVHLKRKDYDQVRDEMLGSEGITLIRIRNKEIEKDPRIVLERIEEFMGNK